MRGKIVSILPQSSIVGMLLENANNYTVVKSFYLFKLKQIKAFLLYRNLRSYTVKNI